jgi:hypothetical protein
MRERGRGRARERERERERDKEPACKTHGILFRTGRAIFYNFYSTTT